MLHLDNQFSLVFCFILNEFGLSLIIPDLVDDGNLFDEMPMFDDTTTMISIVETNNRVTTSTVVHAQNLIDVAKCGNM